MLGLSSHGEYANIMVNGGLPQGWSGHMPRALQLMGAFSLKIFFKAKAL